MLLWNCKWRDSTYLAGLSWQQIAVNITSMAWCIRYQRDQGDGEPNDAVFECCRCTTLPFGTHEVTKAFLSLHVRS